MGPHLAKRLIMDGTALAASEAQALGLVDLVAGDDFEDVVSAEVSRLAARPTATLGLVKEAVRRGYGLPIDQAMDLEEELVMRNLELHDAAEGIQAFLDKRKVEFEGR